MSDENAFWNDLYREVERRIKKRLDGYRPDLTKTTGVLPGQQLPTGGPSGTGYPPAPHTTAWGDITGVPASFTPSAHASSHQHGGADEVATATPGANAIPKAGAGGTLADGWLSAQIARLNAAQTWTAEQTFAENTTLQKLLKIPTTAGGNGYGIRFGDGTTDYGNFQALDLSGNSFLFFSANRQFDGSAWQLLNSRVGGALQVIGDELAFYNFPASSTTPTQRIRVSSGGALLIGTLTSGLNSPGQLHLSSGTAAALRIDGSGNTASAGTNAASLGNRPNAAAGNSPAGWLVFSKDGVTRFMPYW